MPGSHTSRTMRSTGPRVIRSRQASPLGTASTAYPSSRSTPLSAERTPGSSSTTRMVGFISARQLDCKSSAARRVVADVDIAAMLGDDAPDDRQAETAAAPLGRVVWQEQLL